MSDARVAAEETNKLLDASVAAGETNKLLDASVAAGATDCRRNRQRKLTCRADSTAWNNLTLAFSEKTKCNALRS